VGMSVGKAGRTTGLRRGEVFDIAASVRVEYEQGGRTLLAMFRNQMAIRGAGGRSFIEGGDSGALVWLWDQSGMAAAPVGLGFASGDPSSRVAYANHLSLVLAALDVKLFV
ncbi:MAG TPA: hypothetical protein VKA84_16600, partial [Gemmatimonadaceae bacterium]|nr:hypothetical protein [Gemmatimonadaceae bacterium]